MKIGLKIPDMHMLKHQISVLHPTGVAKINFLKGKESLKNEPNKQK